MISISTGTLDVAVIFGTVTSAFCSNVYMALSPFVPFGLSLIITRLRRFFNKIRKRNLILLSGQMRFGWLRDAIRKAGSAANGDKSANHIDL